MTKIINSKHAPDPVGPYNQAVLKNGFLFTSGQIGIDPKSGDLITDTIENETKQVMANLKAVLTKAGWDFPTEIKETIFKIGVASGRDKGAVCRSRGGGCHAGNNDGRSVSW